MDPYIYELHTLRVYPEKKGVSKIFLLTFFMPDTDSLAEKKRPLVQFAFLSDP